MKQLGEKIKPTKGFSHFLHILLKGLLPALLFLFVRIHFYQVAFALIVLSKWRMFAVKPRHWPANIRANGVDIIVGLSFLIFMIHSGAQLLQLGWAILYAVWLIWLKPKSSLWGVSLQALVAQFLGMTALLINWGAASSWVLILCAWLVSYAAARHFFANFEEQLTRFLAYTWAYTAAALMWVTSHWLVYYGYIAQPALLLSVVAAGLGGMYYLQKNDQMSVLLRRQIIFVVIAVVVIMLTFSQWGDKNI